MEGIRAHPHDVVAPVPEGQGQLDGRSWRADDFAHGQFSLLLRGQDTPSNRNGALEMQQTPSSAEAGQHRVVRRLRFPAHDKSWLEQVWLQRRRQHSTSCKGRGLNSECDRYLPPSSQSSPNIHWSWISASSRNVCRTRRQEGPQDRQGAATRCGGGVWTIMRSSSCSSGLLKISLEQTFLTGHASHSCQQQ